MYISLKDVTKRYDEKLVLNHISLEVEQGNILALLGPSGCGKTTLLNALAGLVEIESGVIEVNRQLFSNGHFSLPPEARRIGMVFQDFALWPHMNVFDNIAFGLKVQRLSRAHIAQRVRDVLEIVQLQGYEKQYPHQLSGGQKQRVAIARALAPQPSVLLMDEPLSSLDAKLRVEMRWQLVDIVRRTGITTIYVTHDQVEALTMADTVVLLHDGQIEQQGSPMELYEKPESSFTASFVGSSNLIPCDIISKDHAITRVRAAGIVWTTPSVDYITSPNAILMIRPDAIYERDASCEGKRGVQLSGQIQQMSYLGSQWTYRVHIQDGPDFMMDWVDTTHRQLGDVVHLWIPESSTRLVRSTDKEKDAKEHAHV